MSPRGCWVTALVLLLVNTGWASSCSATPPSCSAWSSDAPVLQVPVQVSLCLTHESPARLSLQDHDGNAIGNLSINRKKDGDLLLEATKEGDNEPKNRKLVPSDALQDGRLHLKIKYDNFTELLFSSKGDALLYALPVSKTAFVRVRVDQPHDFLICSQDSAATRSGSQVTQLARNYGQTHTSTTQGEDDDAVPGKEVVLIVTTLLVGVAVVFSLALLGLTVSLP